MARGKREVLARKRRLPEARSKGINKRQRGGEAQTQTQASTKLYSAEDDVLVLGDGDFSFSRGLVKHRGDGRGVFATSFDSQTQVRRKYPNAQECISAVRSAHGLVFHDVDATRLQLLPSQVSTGHGTERVPEFFQYIVFNFPHSGQQRVHINRALLLNFFESARGRLAARGEAHVTLKTRPPYSNWFIEEQAKTAGFVLKERRKLNIRLFPGYHHRTTDPQAKKFEADLCVTYVFVVNRVKYPFQASRVAMDEAAAEAATSLAEQQQSVAAAIFDIFQHKTASPSNGRGEGQQEAETIAIAPAARTKHATSNRTTPKKEQTRAHATAAVSRGVSVKAASPCMWKPLHRPAAGAFTSLRR